MNVELETILTIIGAMGGIEGIKWGVRAWVNRKTDARKEGAAADSAEIQNLLNIINSLTVQLENADRRTKERDVKVDYVYGELRKEQADHLNTIHKLHEVTLSLKEAEVRRCDIRKCDKREPPSDY